MLNGMSTLTAISFCFFVSAKILGFLGVILGFGTRETHQLGGYMLVGAFVAIITSITLALIQLRKEKFEDDLALSSKG
jgi:hypothetical protein